MDKVEQNKVNDTISDDIVLQSKKKAMKAYRWEVIDTIYCFLISFAPFALAIHFGTYCMNHDVVTTIHYDTIYGKAEYALVHLGWYVVFCVGIIFGMLTIFLFGYTVGEAIRIGDKIKIYKNIKRMSVEEYRASDYLKKFPYHKYEV